MDQALILVSKETDPYANLATEHLLMDVVLPGEQILFLWQNSNTIVIGRNQDAWRECRVTEFEEEGGRLARRLSGGGAVYHDVGNLNFTFISPRESYDVVRNMEIIKRAVRSFGPQAELSGRNDVEVDGAKFSGNAFFSTKQAECHHGTLMVAVDTQKLARYLKPDPRKLQSRGVASVQSRVVNLQSLEGSITIDSLSSALADEFLKCYGNTSGLPIKSAMTIGELSDVIPSPHVIPGLTRDPQKPESVTTGLPITSAMTVEDAPLLEGSGALRNRLDPLLYAEARERFASTEWRLGRQHKFDQRLDKRYSWGGLDLQFALEKGHVKRVHIYSDVLDVGFVDALSAALEGVTYTPATLTASIEALEHERPEYQTMLSTLKADIIEHLQDTE